MPPKFTIRDTGEEANVLVYLEPSRLDDKLRPMLKGQMHDALWMLSQQDRMKEFIAEDAGTAVEVRFELDSQRFKTFKSGSTETDYNLDIPLETQIERLPIQFNLGLKILFARKFYKILKATTNSADFAGVILAIKDHFPLIINNGDKSDVYNMEIIDAMDYLHFDAEIIYKKIIDGKFYNQPGEPNSPTGLNLLLVTETFENWIKNNYLPDYGPNWNVSSNWDIPSMGYNAKVAAHPTYDTNKTVLAAKDYDSGRLDWYSFDKDIATAVNADPPKNSTLMIAKVPSPVSYNGMPTQRWWEFEDQNIDLASELASDSSKDILKRSVLEYMNQYSNDWLIVPIDLKVASMNKIGAIVVKDCFGMKTAVLPALDNNNESWDNWNLFNYNELSDINSTDPTSFVLAPNLTQLQESEPIEQIQFLRDEMSNMVWGIEKQVPNALGRGIRGYDAWNAYNKYILDNLNIEVPRQYFKENNAEHAFELMNSFPENWIPFIPVRKDNGALTEIHFQRATYNRIIPTEPQINTGEYIKPRTKLLMPDKDSTLFFNEEEILRTGSVLSTTFQRARWSDGSVHLWLGNKKQVGYGEGSSELRFDKLANKKDYSKFEEPEIIYDVFHNFEDATEEPHGLYGKTVNHGLDIWYSNAPGTHLSIESNEDSPDAIMVSATTSTTDELMLEKTLEPNNWFNIDFDLNFEGTSRVSVDLKYQDYMGIWRNLYSDWQYTSEHFTFMFELPKTANGNCKLTLKVDTTSPTTFFKVSKFRISHEAKEGINSIQNVFVDPTSLSFEDINSSLLAITFARENQMSDFGDFISNSITWPVPLSNVAVLIKDEIVVNELNLAVLYEYSPAGKIAENSNALYISNIVNGTFPSTKFCHAVINQSGSTIASEISNLNTLLDNIDHSEYISHCYNFDKRAYLDSLFALDLTTFDMVYNSVVPSTPYANQSEAINNILNADQLDVETQIVLNINPSINLGIISALEDISTVSEEHTLVGLFGSYPNVKSIINNASINNNEIDSVSALYPELIWDALVITTPDNGIIYLNEFIALSETQFIQNAVKAYPLAAAAAQLALFPNKLEKVNYLNQIALHYSEDIRQNLRIYLKRKFLK